MKVSSTHGFVFILLLWWASSQCSAVEMQTLTRPYVIPIEHRYASEFARFLQKAGLIIEKIQGWHLAAMFESLHEILQPRKLRCRTFGLKSRPKKTD